MVISTKDFDNGEIQQRLADAWLNIYVDEKRLYNPLDWPKEYDEVPEKYLAWVMTRPEYFSFICQEVLNVRIIPTQAVMLKEMWNRRFPMLIASRGFGKSFIMSVYAMLRILLMQGRKVMLAGAVFRQSKVVFEYMEALYYNAPVLRDAIGNKAPIRHDTDMYRFRIADSTCTAIPIGDGSKIRGQRANDLLVDEFASVPQAIFENVLAGFAAVKSHPIEHVMQTAADDMAKLLGVYEEPDEDEEDSAMKDNQIIISGTAYYDFNHFGTYWKDWHEIICSKGDPKVLADYFRRKAQDQNRDDVEIPEGFNWRDYSIIRVPFELIPKGFMDAAQVARSRATIHAGIYLMEFGACFSTDSNGFFSRKLIESCIASPTNNISFASCGEVFYEAKLTGDPNRRYVYGIDPASEVDNFSIVVIELHNDHRRIVYGWTTNRSQHNEEIEAKLVNELDYYSYCAKKIRWLMTRFPCERIMMDSQGGGIPVMEALHDPDKIDHENGELPMWPVTDPEKPQMTDAKAGLHIVELVNFASAAWTEEANHGMRKDLEDKVLLFPYFDAITVANASYSDGLNKMSYDTLEDCVMDIEELKDELSTIIITQTTSGRDKWDTPEIKLPGGKKGRLRKDRYSALVMANMGARQLMRAPAPYDYDSHGGFAGRMQYDEGSLYAGNEEFDLWAKEFYAD